LQQTARQSGAAPGRRPPRCGGAQAPRNGDPSGGRARGRGRAGARPGAARPQGGRPRGRGPGRARGRQRLGGSQAARCAGAGAGDGDAVQRAQHRRLAAAPGVDARQGRVGQGIQGGLQHRMTCDLAAGRCHGAARGGASACTSMRRLADESSACSARCRSRALSGGRPPATPPRL